MRLISDGFGSELLAVGASRSLSPSRMSLHSLTHSLQMYTDGPETSRATSSWPRPQNEQRIGWGVAMRFFMRVLSSFEHLRFAHQRVFAALMRGSAPPGSRPPAGQAQRRFSMISSTRPYAFDSSAVIQ